MENDGAPVDGGDEVKTRQHGEIPESGLGLGGLRRESGHTFDVYRPQQRRRQTA